MIGRVDERSLVGCVPAGALRIDSRGVVAMCNDDPDPIVNPNLKTSGVDVLEYDSGGLVMKRGFCTMATPDRFAVIVVARDPANRSVFPVSTW